MSMFMKKYICFFAVTIFSFTVLYAAPSSSDLIGIWTATVGNNRSFDTYRINFTADGRCTVKVSNDTAEQETSGNWSWDGTLFRINATFRNAKLSYLPNIQWSICSKTHNLTPNLNKQRGLPPPFFLYCQFQADMLWLIA
jgi:hypothetical protein